MGKTHQQDDIISWNLRDLDLTLDIAGCEQSYFLAFEKVVQKVHKSPSNGDHPYENSSILVGRGSNLKRCP